MQEGAIRRILHCDLDCFYAAVHMRDDASLRGRPVVVGGDPKGRGVVAAANYEARRFGIHSALPAARAVRLCPHLIFIRPDFPLYRKESDAIFAIYRSYTPLVQPLSLDEATLDVTDHLGELPSATHLAREIRQRVATERGLTVSVGVAPSRLVAKIASDQDKPDGLTVVKPAQVQAFLDPLSARRIPGVGPVTAEKLATLGVQTIADLRGLPLETLERRFGRHGRSLHDRSRGIDPRPVRVERKRKSLSSERTYARDLRTVEEMQVELDKLAERVSRSLQKKEISGRTITLKVRFPDFTTLTRARTLNQPFVDLATLRIVATELLEETVRPGQSIRLLGLGVSKLDRGEQRQMSLF